MVDDSFRDFMALVGTLHLLVDGEATLYIRLSMREQQELADNLPATTLDSLESSDCSVDLLLHQI